MTLKPALPSKAVDTTGDSLKRFVGLALTLGAVSLCWADICWAFRPGLFPIFDELSNPAMFLFGSYRQFFHLLPDTFYGNRPIGWAFIRLLYDVFGFNYAGQVGCLLTVHFTNCGLAFALYRRLGLSTLISIAGVTLFGSLSTTALTATYVGASFDVLASFFLLLSVLAALSERRGAAAMSAALFLAALRTKEFTVVTPILLTVLVALRLPEMPFRTRLAIVVRRLWLHYAIFAIVVARYLFLFSAYRAQTAPNNPYYIDLHTTTFIKSLAWYAALIFGMDQSSWQLSPLVLIIGLAVVLCWAVLRRRGGIAFGVCGFVATLLPVCLIPNQRMPFYVYGPQIFLILVLCLLAEETVAAFFKTERWRWTVCACLVLACLLWCAAFRRSSYFHDRVNLNLMYRRAGSRTAHDVATQFPMIGPGTHLYVNRTHDKTTWVRVPWPCDYLRLVNRQRGISCVTDEAMDQLLRLYENDRGPKFLVEYHDENGSMKVADYGRPVVRNNAP